VQVATKIPTVDRRSTILISANILKIRETSRDTFKIGCWVEQVKVAHCLDSRVRDETGTVVGFWISGSTRGNNQESQLLLRKCKEKVNFLQEL
jgi:hypothetical protein